MREHWIKYQVKDIIEGLFDGPHATPAPSEEGPVFLGVKNLTEDGRLDLSEIRHIAEADFPRWTKRVLPKNDDIVFTYEASLHRYGLLKNDLRCCLGRRMALLRLDKSIVDPQFLLYYFLSSEWKQTVEQNIIVGATVNRIPISDVPSFELALPSLEEQTQIAEVLAGIDAKIDLNNRINAELEAMAKLLYDYWFVQFDFPISAAYAASVGRPDLVGKPYKSSGGKMVYNKQLKREIPEGWEVKTIKEIAVIKAGGDKPNAYSEVKTDSCQVPIYSNGITNDGLYGYTNKATIFKQSVTISARGTIGYSVMRNRPFVPIIRLITITPNNSYEVKFLHESIKLLEFDNSGSVQRQLTVPQISSLKILMPDTEILRIYHSLSYPGMEKIEVNKEENQQLTELRDWLLPMLMNGQVKVQ